MMFYSYYRDSYISASTEWNRAKIVLQDAYHYNLNLCESSSLGDGIKLFFPEYLKYVYLYSYLMKSRIGSVSKLGSH